MNFAEKFQELGLDTFNINTNQKKIDAFCNGLSEHEFQIFMKAYETAVETRKLELELFWKRSLFFWGFIASAFVGYSQLNHNSFPTLVLACFGFVCSVAWTLSNRGNKYWYETWEIKLNRIERLVTGPNFAKEEKCRFKNKSGWLDGHRFSVSRLAIALSDYSIVIWLFLIGFEVYSSINKPLLHEYRAITFFLIATGTFFFAVCMWKSSQSKKDLQD